MLFLALVIQIPARLISAPALTLKPTLLTLIGPAAGGPQFPRHRQTCCRLDAEVVWAHNLLYLGFSYGDKLI